MTSKDIEVLPLGWSESGEPIRVPSGATGWRVKMYRPGAKKPDLVRTEFGIPTMVPLGATPLEFRALVGAGGRYRLEPVFPDGRSIADSEPAIIVLQEESEPGAAPAFATAHNAGIDRQGVPPVTNVRERLTLPSAPRTRQRFLPSSPGENYAPKTI